MAEGKNWFQKGWSGATRAAGGTADWATMGLTDFDKKGSSIGQFGPIGGGENKRWETGTEAGSLPKMWAWRFHGRPL